MSELVTCKDLTKRFGNHTALDHLNLSLDSGKIIGLLGPNGSGKTTLLKLLNGLLTPSEGEVLIAGNHPGIETKRIVSYLPDKMYLGSWMRVSDLLTYYSDFFEDFDMSRANAMLESLKISPKDRLKTMSKGTKEKVQLILTMSRRAKLYCLDEPIAGVDPAARDYILSTILNNYEPDASILISTHLISDVENILDEVIFIQEGQLKLHASVEDIRMQEGESIDSYFREVFKCGYHILGFHTYHHRGALRCSVPDLPLYLKQTAESFIKIALKSAAADEPNRLRRRFVCMFCTYARCQISSLYCAMVRSEEKKPAFAMLIRHFLFHASLFS